MKVIIASTGSGGHLTAAISLAEELKKRSPGLDVYFIVSQNDLNQKLLKDKGFRIIFFPTLRQEKSFSLQSLILIIKLLDIAVRSLFLIIKIRPDLTVGFGGYISGPVILFSHLLSVKTIIHEQNLKLGASNKLLSKFVETIALSFEGSLEFLGQRDKAVISGNPLRKEFAGSFIKSKARLDFGLLADRFTILVCGGSLGARHINQEFINLLRAWEESEPIQVIHISGELDFNDVAAAYDEISIPHRVFGHFSSMQNAYAASDLVICRSGATTIAELAFFGLPAIFVPYPFAKGDHQSENAVLLRDASAAILIKDDELSLEVLKKNILGLIRDQERLIRMSHAMKSFAKPKATQELADLVLSNLK